jgi:glucose-1-phosphate thymidylyltransferase
MKGIILAGGEGTRLYPLTLHTSKQLLPVYDKPMIYYPLSTLMLSGIKDILIISDSKNIINFKKLFSHGSSLGIKIQYTIQEKPEGIAQALTLGKDFIDNKEVCLILGDNIFYGSDFINYLKNAVLNSKKLATIFAYQVSNPSAYGVVSFDKNNNPNKIIEKPKNSKSNFAVTGLYFYPAGVSKIASDIKKSDRGEYEITSVNQKYLNSKKLKVTKLGRGFTWLDAGTHKDLIEASSFIYSVEKRQGLKIACLEEIALNQNFISKETFKKNIKNLKGNSSYVKYLKYLSNEI